MKSLLSRHFLISALLGCALSAHAQKPPEHSYTLHFSAPLDHVQAKTLLEALLAQDPSIVLSVDEGTTVANARTTHVLDLSQLSIELRASGAELTVQEITTTNAVPVEAGMPADFPVMPNTGDPQADQDAYQTAKAAWMQAHPQEYEQLTAPQ